MLNLPLFARVCLLSGMVLSGWFHAPVGEVAAAEFRSINEMLGFEGDLLGIPWVSVSSISGDGNKIGGSSRSDGFIDDCANLACEQAGFVLKWRENSPVFLPALPPTPRSPRGGAAVAVSALSYDGNTAAVDFDLNDGYYRAETSIVRDGKILALRERVSQEDVLRATDISSDGSVVIGVTRSTAYEPFRWTESSGLQSLSGIASGSGYGSTAISGNGQVVLLNDGVTSFSSLTPLESLGNALRWTESTGTHELLPLSGADYSHAAKTSFDGSVTVGTSRSLISGRVQFDRLVLGSELLTQATAWIEGSPVLLESPISFDSTNAIDVSSDGLLIVGSARNDSEVTDVFRFPQAILWRDGEAFVLQDLLMEQYGLANELAGWHLTSATAISDDGTVIAGQGIDPDGFSAAWVATLVIPEPAALMLLLCLLMPMAVGRRRC